VSFFELVAIKTTQQKYKSEFVFFKLKFHGLKKSMLGLKTQTGLSKMNVPYIFVSNNKHIVVLIILFTSFDFFFSSIIFRDFGKIILFAYERFFKRRKKTFDLP
jgi:hypothetical protein